MFCWQKSTQLSVSPRTVFYWTLLGVCVCLAATSRPVLVPFKSKSAMSSERTSKKDEKDDHMITAVTDDTILHLYFSLNVL